MKIQSDQGSGVLKGHFMRKTSLFRVVALLFISTLLLTSCKPAATVTPTEPIPTETGSVETTDEVVQPNTSAPTTEKAPTPTLNQPTPTLIVETRLPPEQWREWPVIPELTGREQAIYQLGLSLGNDPTNFSKVGDCQAIKSVLMGIYDQPDRYILAENEAYLQETIDHFTGSFNRDGQGVRGGYNAAAVLSPIWADPEACQPGESPIKCEERIHNPSFVIISLEVWWEGRTVERYEEYMRQIIEFYIDNGVVPILSTKADNVEGDHRINLATARLAYEYHIPLWNFWLAVQPMPNHGIDPTRDGFHISYAAWTVRSYTALQALDAVWRGVRAQETAAETPAATPKPTVEFAAINMTPVPVAPPVPVEGEKIVFSLEQRSGEVTESAGIFTYDSTTQTLYQILDSGYRLHDIDPTGTALLISQGSQLFISDQKGATQLITDKLAITGRDASAFWMPDGIHLVVLTEQADVRTLRLVNPTSDNWQSIAEGNIAGMIKPTSDSTFYWYEGLCDPDSTCEDNTLWRTQTGVSESFSEHGKVGFSNDGETYAWTETTEGTTIILYTRTADQALQDYLYLPGNRMADIAWSPFNNRLVLLTVTRSDYSGKSSDARIFVVDTDTMSHLEYYAFPGLNPTVHWQADAGSLLLTSTLPTDNGYQLHFRVMNLTSGLFETLDENLLIESEDFITIDQLFWIFP
jgi:hypothetical protein